MDHSVDQQLGKIGSMVSVNGDAPGVGIGPIWGEFVATSRHTNR
jgi:hypothetical protein